MASSYECGWTGGGSLTLDGDMECGSSFLIVWFLLKCVLVCVTIAQVLPVRHQWIVGLPAVVLLSVSSSFLHLSRILANCLINSHFWQMTHTNSCGLFIEVHVY